MKRFVRLVCIIEVISVVVFFLCLAGGVAFDTDFWMQEVCRVVANTCWMLAGVSMIILIIMLAAMFMMFMMKLVERGELAKPYDEALEAKKKDKMPAFWIVLAIVWYVIMWMVALPLMAAGAA